MVHIRPGPVRLLPGIVPGGIVVHTYNSTGQRLTESRIDATTPIAADAVAAAVQAKLNTREGEPVVIVVYDGDTGERWDYDDWMRATGLPPGPAF